MPESVTDRCTRSHEYIFMLAKAERYYCDMESIKEPCESGPSDIRKMEQSLERIGGKHKILVDPFSKASSTTNIGQKRSVGNPSGRNRRSVWNVSTQPYPEAHFATFPEDLIKPCILAGTSHAGCCSKCGAPWERITEETNRRLTDRKNNNAFKHDKMTTNGEGATTLRVTRDVATRGWEPSCHCYVSMMDQPTINACIVLDPFVGSGTTVKVAQDLGRIGIGLDLKWEYLKLAQRRSAQRGLILPPMISSKANANPQT